MIDTAKLQEMVQRTDDLLDKLDVFLLKMDDMSNRLLDKLNEIEEDSNDHSKI